jgi:Arylsulfotransferase (ASST)
LVTALFLLLVNGFCFSQVVPAPGAKLNYTQIMFEHGTVKGADEYVMEVSLDEAGLSFQYPVARQRDSSTAAMLSNFEFGKKYVWRYEGLHKGKELGWQGPYGFEILSAPYVDKNLCRVRIVENDSTAHAGGLVILDEARIIVDRNGNFVWYLPPDNNTRTKSMMTRGSSVAINDLRVTPQGAVTLINATQAEERDLNGNLLWQAPKQLNAMPGGIGSTPRYGRYNHCFKKLANGNYMVIENISVLKPASFLGKKDTNMLPVADEILEEFDRKGQMVWSWGSECYFDSAEIQSTITSAADKALLNNEPGGHMNAFDVDEKNGFVYAGFRHVSRVIKIDKTTGKVVCAWGENMTYNGAKNGDGFFLKQHETTLLHDGTIAVFSNNSQLTDTSKKEIPASSVVIFSQPDGKTNSQIVWKYDCHLDSLHNLSGRGGSVDEMKNGNLLVSMGTVNHVFEITRDKRIVWSAVIEKFNTAVSVWGRFPLYRAHYTSSLYPCYFTVQADADTLNKKSPSFNLRIFNDGSENDSYVVKVSSASGHYNKQFITPVLSGRKSINFIISPNQRPKGDDKIEVIVTSNTNPDFKRLLELPYK